MSTCMSIAEMREHEWIIAWSGGKDSTATIILCHLYRIPIKKIIYVRMMWDKDTPATLPVMTEFVDRAKEVFEGWGYPVEIIPSKKTAKELTEMVYYRSKYPQKNGKFYGITSFMRGFCKFTGIKQETIATLTSSNDYEMIGYASDEAERLSRLIDRKQSILVALGIKEQDTFPICSLYNLLSPLYELDIKRDGCWFCPNGAVRERALLKQSFPELVQEIRNMIEMCDYDLTPLASRNHWLQEYFKGEL